MNLPAEHRRQSGFTLIELMIVVAIVAILATLAAPSFVTAIANNRVSTASTELQSLLQYARAEAIYKRSESSVSNSSQTWSANIGSTVLREFTVPGSVTITPADNSTGGVKFDTTGTAILASSATPPYVLTLTATKATRMQCITVTRAGVVRLERKTTGSTC